MPTTCRVHDRSSLSSLIVGLLGSMAMPGVALAHPGPHHASDLIAGMLHPFTGIDHLLAMIAVGMWAARMGRNAVWVLPMTFPLAMIGGAILGSSIGFASGALPVIEPAIAISVVVLGTAVARGVRLPMIASAMLIASFAVFHGYAHGIEAPSHGSMLSYAAGFTGATVLLHLLGIAIGAWFARIERLVAWQVSGSLIAMSGAVLLFA